MSELINNNDNRATIRWKLLTGASILALTAYVSTGELAHAENGDQPQVWIELGGQLSRLEDGQETFSPAIMAGRPSKFAPSQPSESPPLFSIDEDGKISFQPESSDWIMSASIRYGHSVSTKHVHQQDFPVSRFYTPSGSYALLSNAPARFADTSSRNGENHLVLDFQAGKDVGLGLLGHTASSVLSAGVRIAHFQSSSNISLKSDPDWAFKYATGFNLPIGWNYHSNSAALHASRSFQGIGPSLSWAASAPFAGNSQDGQLTLDWSVNAALLFGRQKTHTHHQTTGRYHYWKYALGSKPITYQGPAHPDHTRSRNVTVPNVGGSVGLSWNLQNFKMSVGYKADFFFNAIDGGIDARKSENRGFFGPYASISIGLGD